jgi:hypothetical protein
MYRSSSFIDILVSMISSHTLVSQVCPGILLYLDDDITKDGAVKFPLAEYAAEHWFKHARSKGVLKKGRRRDETAL